MASDINQVFLIGRLTRDGELKYTNSGTAYSKVSIACNESQKGPTGQYEDKGHFFDCTIWGKTAESLNQYLTKGKQVSIVGRLRQETWTDANTGQNRSKVTISVFTLQLLQDPAGSSQRGDWYDQQSSRGQQAPRQSYQQPSGQGYQQSGPSPYYQPPQQQGSYPQQQGGQMTFAGPETFVDDNIPF